MAERGKRRGNKIKNPKPYVNFTLVAAWLSISKKYKDIQEWTYRIHFERKNRANLFCLLVEAHNLEAAQIAVSVLKALKIFLLEFYL